MKKRLIPGFLCGKLVEKQEILWKSSVGVVETVLKHQKIFFSLNIEKQTPTFVKFCDHGRRVKAGERFERIHTSYGAHITKSANPRYWIW